MTWDPALVAVTGGLSVLAFVVAVWLPAYVRARLVERRIAGIAPGNGLAVDRGGQRPVSSTVLPSLRSGGRLGWLNDALARARLDITAGEVLAATAILVAAGAGIAYFLMADIVIAAAAAVLSATLPFLWIGLSATRRRQRFVAQLPDTVQLLSSLVRGGNTFLQALENVGTESEEPTRSALAVVVREIGLGASQESAMERLATRYPSDDLTLLVASVNVHQQIGGSLSGILERIAETLRERVRLRGEVRTLTAAQRLSAYVLAALPVLVAVGRAMTDPQSFSLFFTVEYLRLALIVAGLMVLAGSLLMRRIASIDV